jgi:hypothetical protein
LNLKQYLFYDTLPCSRTRAVVRCVVAAVVIPVVLVVSFAYSIWPLVVFYWPVSRLLPL